jgi:hypothetical protein
VEVLDPALFHRRLIAYGGVFKSVKRRLKLTDEAENTDVSRPKGKEIFENPLIEKMLMVFDFGLGAYKVEKFFDGKERKDLAHLFPPEEKRRTPLDRLKRIKDGGNE